jgi:hypothetical protein
MKKSQKSQKGKKCGLVVLTVIGVLSLFAVGASVVAVELSFGPVDVGSYGLSGPKTWTVFSGPAKVVLQCGPYKLWQRNDPNFGIGG